VTAGDTTAPPAGPLHEAGPWQHLDIRVVWVNAVAFLLSLGSGVAGLFLFPHGEVWPLLVACAAGVIGTVVDLLRWLTTRYRITDSHVEKRTGWLRREYRRVPRERIRSVDTSAKLRHRLTRLRMVHIGAGEARAGSTFSLNALTKDKAAELRRELIPDHQEAAEQEVVISRVRWYWVFYTMFQFWALLAAGFFVNAAYWGLNSIGIDLINVVENLAKRSDFGVGWTIVIGLAATLVVGFAVLAADFIAKYWNFELVRTMDQGGALLTRHGLFTTRTVYRDDSRTRGIHIYEPLALRWMRLAETTVVTAGIHPLHKETANILPRCPVSEARHVAKFVLPDGVHPLEAPLSRHPRSALRKRLVRATYEPLVVAGILAWLGATNAVPDWTWRIPVALLPAAWALGVVDYFTLGHTLVGPYLVVRSGAVGRSTLALQCRAVAGWTLHQTIFQRIGKRMTVGISTSAGARHYRAPDAGVNQALALIRGATPGFTEAFIEEAAPTNRGNPGQVTTGGFGGRK
jgi:putative membrane protein